MPIARHTKRRRPEELILFLRDRGPVLHWWEPRPEFLSLSGTDITNWGDRAITNAAPIVTNTGILTYSATGGPATRPVATLSTTSTCAIASNLAIANGNRTALYMVAAPAVGAGALRLFGVLRADNTTTGITAANMGISATDQPRTFVTFTAGTTETVTATAAVSAGYRLFALRPTTGTTKFQINGVESVPTFVGAGAAGPALSAIGSFQLGQAFGSAGGSVAMVMLVDISNADWATTADLMIRNYVSQHFGIIC